MNETTMESNSHADSMTASTLKRSDPGSQLASDICIGIDSFYTWDSSFVLVQRYNKAFNAGVAVADLGTVGSPQRILKFSPFLGSGFQTGFQPYAIQNKNPDNFVFYKAAVPLTKFYYTQGANGVFLLDVLHTQNFSPNWNVTIDFSSVQNAEIYTGSGQNHLHRGTMIGSQFTDKKAKYSQQLILSWNRARRSENRGLINDSLFFLPNDSITVRKLGNYYPVSTSTNSYYGTHHHLLDQKLRFGSNFYVFLRNEWMKEVYAYSEKDPTPDTGFYGSKFTFNSGAFIDSVVWIQFKNSAGFGKESKYDDIFPLTYRVSASYNRALYNTIYKTESDKQYYSGIHARLTYNPYGKKALTVNAISDYYLTGNFSGNYLVSAKADWRLQRNIFLIGGLRSQQYNAPAYTTKYNGNYTSTLNNFVPIQSNMIQVGIKARIKHLQANLIAEAGSQNNFIYSNTNGSWSQGLDLTYANISGNLDVNFGKFHWINRLVWQTHSQQELIPMPKFHVISGLYFEGQTFKKAMLMRAGADIMYSSSYNAYKYNPMTAIFYPGTARAGNYPLVDVYVSGEIKTVMLFLKMEHINQYLSNVGFNNSYFSAQHYPIEPLRFRFGFIWRFHN